MATQAREASVLQYVNALEMDRAATHELRYGLINRAFGLPEETKQSIGMVQKERMPFLQVDQYPAQAEMRQQQEGYLPAGNSMVSVLVENIDRLPIEDMKVGDALRSNTAIYKGRKSQVIKGLAFELIELIEIE